MTTWPEMRALRTTPSPMSLPTAPGDAIAGFGHCVHRTSGRVDDRAVEPRAAPAELEHELVGFRRRIGERDLERRRRLAGGLGADVERRRGLDTEVEAAVGRRRALRDRLRNSPRHHGE